METKNLYYFLCGLGTQLGSYTVFTCPIIQETKALFIVKDLCGRTRVHKEDIGTFNKKSKSVYLLENDFEKAQKIFKNYLLEQRNTMAKEIDAIDQSLEKDWNLRTYEI